MIVWYELGNWKRIIWPKQNRQNKVLWIFEKIFLKCSYVLCIAFEANPWFLSNPTFTGGWKLQLGFFIGIIRDSVIWTLESISKATKINLLFVCQRLTIWKIHSDQAGEIRSLYSQRNEQNYAVMLWTQHEQRRTWANEHNWEAQREEKGHDSNSYALETRWDKTSLET